ncbi:MAG: sensor histidine kinase, partial [Acetobacteraceae bacterium]|nr:sensor histidine kinase [Acetobacteraceae bacterium]
DYLRALCDAERQAVLGAASVALYTDLRPVRVRAEAAALIGFAFAELLRNALAHAFPRDGRGHVGVHLWPISGLPSLRAFLLVADDGQGFGDEPPVTSERGIPLARHLVERCGGTLKREPDRHGTVWRIAVPELPHEDAAARVSGLALHDTSLGAFAAPPSPAP